MGETAFQEMLSRCNVKILEKNIWYDNGLDRYKAFYNNLKAKEDYVKCIPIIECNFNEYNKYLHMINKNVLAVCLVRDPIKIMASVYNYKILKNKDNLNFSNLNCNDNLLNNYYYAATKNKTIISKKEIKSRINDIKNINKNIRFTYIAQTHLINLKNISHVYYIDVSEISNNKAYETLYKLSKIVGFSLPNNSKLINNLSYTHYLRFIFDIEKPIIYRHYFDSRYIELYLYNNYRIIDENFYNITNMFNFKNKESYMNNIFIIIKKNHFNSIHNKKDILYEVKFNINIFLNKINNMIKIFKKESIKDNDILEILSKNYESCRFFKQLIEYEFSDFLNSNKGKYWYYYKRLI
ncbi:DUF2972 domain-containing protein [Campylobacter sp. RM10542]|nr:DUF2972 domain-containing protein [Campylobacter sp. RM10542]